MNKEILDSLSRLVDIAHEIDSLVDRIGLAEFERVMADPESRIQEMKATRVREAIAS